MCSKRLLYLFLILSSLCTISCSPAKKDYQRPHQEKPSSEIDESMESESTGASPEVQQLSRRLHSSGADPYKDVFTKYGEEILRSRSPLRPDKIANEETLEKLNLINSAVLLMFEDNHPNLEDALKAYEASLLQRCSNNGRLNDCLRLPLFKKDPQSALIALLIARTYRQTQTSKYFTLVDLSLAIKNDDVSSTYKNIYLEDFPGYYEKLLAGHLPLPAEGVLKRRKQMYKEAACEVSQVRASQVSQQVIESMSRQLFSFQTERPSDSLDVGSECLSRSLGGKLFTQLALKRLNSALQSINEAVKQTPVDSTLFSLPNYFEAYALAKGQTFDIFALLNIKELNPLELKTPREKYLFFLLDQVFHGNLSTETAESLFAEVRSQYQSDAILLGQIKQMVHSYFGTYLIVLSHHTHRYLGEFFKTSSEEGQSFIRKLQGRITTTRGPWRVLQKNALRLDSFFKETLYKSFRAGSKQLPPRYEAINELIVGLPQNVKHIGDLPAYIMFSVYLAKKDWSISFGFWKKNASMIINNLLDGKEKSIFEFSAPQNSADEIEFGQSEIAYGLDYLFRLKLYDQYGVSLSELFETIASQYMKSTMDNTNSYGTSAYNFHDKMYEPLMKMVESPRLKNVMDSCEKLKNAETLAIEIFPPQFHNAAGLGLPAMPDDQLIGSEIKQTLNRSKFIRLFYQVFSPVIRSSESEIPGKGFEANPHPETAEFVRTTIMPRLDRLKVFLVLLERALIDHGEDPQPIVHDIKSRYFETYYSALSHVYTVFDDLVAPAFDCMIDLDLIEERRRDFIIKMEKSYFIKLFKAIQFYKNHIHNTNLVNTSVSQIKSQFYPKHEIFKDPYFKQFLDARGHLNFLEFLRVTINNPHLGETKNKSWLTQLFQRRDPIKVSSNGDVYLTMTPQRFSYRAKNYYENGFWVGSEHVTYSDSLTNHFSNYPVTYEQVNNSALLKEFFDQSGYTFRVPDSQIDFMNEAIKRFEESFIAGWYGAHFKYSHEVLFTMSRLDVSRIRNFKERMDFTPNDCDIDLNRDACIDEKLSELISSSVHRWARVFEALEASETQRNLARRLGATSPYGIRNDTFPAIQTWVSNKTQFVYDTNLNPLPYFDYFYAVMTSPFIGTTAGLLRGRVENSGSSPWELKLDELKRAREFYDSTKTIQNQYGLDEDGAVRANNLLIDTHKKRVSEYFSIVNRTQEVIRKFSPDQLPPLNFYVDREPVHPPLLDSQMIDNVNEDFRKFHCYTDNLFATPELFCD